MASYCPQCGEPLQEGFAFGKNRLVSPRCGYVHFEDPKVAVGVVVEIDGGIVLGQRGHEPQIGRWSFPSGYVDAGEVLEEAAVREVQEETGLEIRIDRLIGAYSRAGDRIVFIAYAGSVVGGELAAGEECLAVGVFPPDRLPDLAFPHDEAIIRAWADGRHAPR